MSCFSPSFFPFSPFLYLSVSHMLGRSRRGFLYLCTRLVYCSNIEPPSGGNYAPLEPSESSRAKRQWGSIGYLYLKHHHGIKLPLRVRKVEMHEEKQTVPVVVVTWAREDEQESAKDSRKSLTHPLHTPILVRIHFNTHTHTFYCRLDSQGVKSSLCVGVCEKE